MVTLRIMFEENVIQSEDFKNIVIGNNIVGFSLKVRLGYYRSLPLSTIKKFELSIGGNSIPAENIVFLLNNKRFMLSQLSEMYMEYWNLLECAELQIMQDGGLPPGQYEVRLEFELRSPYLPTGPDHQYATIDSSDSRIIELQV